MKEEPTIPTGICEKCGAVYSGSGYTVRRDDGRNCINSAMVGGHIYACGGRIIEQSLHEVIEGEKI